MKMLISALILCTFFVALAEATLPPGTRFILHGQTSSSGNVNNFYTNFALTKRSYPHQLLPLPLSHHTSDRQFFAYMQTETGYNHMLTVRHDGPNAILSWENPQKETGALLKIPTPHFVFEVGTGELLVGWIENGLPQVSKIKVAGRAQSFFLKVEHIDLTHWFVPDVHGLATTMEATEDGLMVATEHYLIQYQFQPTEGTVTIKSQFDLSALKKVFYLDKINVAGLWTHGNKGWLALQLHGSAFHKILPFELSEDNKITFFPDLQLFDALSYKVLDVEENGNLIFTASSPKPNSNKGLDLYVKNIKTATTSRLTSLGLDDLNKIYRFDIWLTNLPTFDQFYAATEPFPLSQLGFYRTVTLDYPRSKFYPLGRPTGRFYLTVDCGDILKDKSMLPGRK